MTLPLSPGGRRFGYIRNPPDHRDLGLSSMRLKIKLPPPSFSLKEFLGPTKDQGDEGSCTAHAGTENLEFLYRKYKTESPIFSPAFLYYQARLLDGDPNDDGGSTGRSSCIAMQKSGVCLESIDPYIAGQYAIPPTPAQTQNAALYKSGAYHFLATVGDMKACIASGYCCMIGFNVYESFERIGSDGVMPVPDTRTESLLGGHEVLCYGYSDDKQRLSILNSWGTGFGDAGSFYMPYSVAADPNVAMDCCIAHLGKPW
jgi:C1A family cysteine protease